MATRLPRSTLVAEFKEFLLKQNALALAIGVVIGAAVAKVVSALVEDVFMPIIGLVLPSGEWRSAELVLSGHNAIKYGDLVGKLIDFTIVALVVFFATKALLPAPEATPASKSCPQCLESVPAAATRCRACGQPV